MKKIIITKEEAYKILDYHFNGNRPEEDRVKIELSTHTLEELGYRDILTEKGIGNKNRYQMTISSTPDLVDISVKNEISYKHKLHCLQCALFGEFVELNEIEAKEKGLTECHKCKSKFDKHNHYVGKHDIVSPKDLQEYKKQGINFSFIGIGYIDGNGKYLEIKDKIENYK